MKLRIKKRGNVYLVEGKVGARYIRLTLKEENQKEAERVTSALERALRDGKTSREWQELQQTLPPSTFRFFAGYMGYVEQPEAPAPTWSDLFRDFSARFRRQILQGDRQESTWRRYRQTCTAFSVFLDQQGLSRLEEITARVIEDFKNWKLERTLARPQSRGGRGLRLDIAVLHGILAFAIEMGLIVRNPVKMEGTPGRDPAGGGQPFSTDELARLREAADKDRLIFLALRHTGLRGGDAVDLRWEDVDLKQRAISRLTQKRRKRVWLALPPELHFALEAECQLRQPQPTDRVLLNPETGRPLTRPRLYERMVALGRRAGVVNSHPHRFRDTLAIDLLHKGASPYDVAKTLGDTVAVIEQHYAPFVRELQERMRRIVENREGIEDQPGGCTEIAQSPDGKVKLQ